MIIEFSVANFRSIYQRCVFSMELNENCTYPTGKYVTLGDSKILRVAGLYGANSSGKSNILKAVSLMKNFILHSSKINEGDPLFYMPFELNQQKNLPTLLEVVFIQNNYTYRYGFEYNSSHIIEEWFTKTSSTENSIEIPLFHRNKDGIECHETEFPEGLDKAELTRSNRLFVSVCSQLNGKESNLLIKWLNDNINLISGTNEFWYENFTKNLLFRDEHQWGEDIRKYYAELKLGFSDIIVQRHEDTETMNLQSIHNIYDDNGKIVSKEAFNFDEMESEGSKKLVRVLGPIIHTLQRGAVLIFDEIDAKLHPLISNHIISLFNNPEINKNGAQLIFATHDTNLLHVALEYPEQIWFTEKNNLDQTDLYSLSEINFPDGSLEHHQEKFQKNYLEGRYGAIPYIINN